MFVRSTSIMIALQTMPAVLAGGALTLAASDRQPAAQMGPAIARSMTVAGDAQIKVVPDRARFTVVLEAHDGDKTEAQKKLQSRAAAMIEAMLGAGQRADGIVTSHMALAPIHELDAKGHTTHRVRGWTATRHLSVSVDDLPKIEGIFGATIEKGGTIQGAITFDTTRIEELREQARRMAARAARDKARLLIDELGGELGAPTSISESAPQFSGPMSYANAVEDWRNGAFAVGSFTSGQLTVSGHVDVVFDVAG